MFVAIINQTNPVGIQPITDYRVAVDEATALDDFVNSYAPPLAPADYLAVDTGWAGDTYLEPPGGLGYRWAYDFGGAVIVEVLRAERLEGIGLVQVIGAQVSDPSGPTTPFAWEDMGRLSMNADFYFRDLAMAQFRVWGQHMTTQNEAQGVQVRLAAGGVPYSNEIDLPDTAGAWQNFDVNSIGYVIPGGRTLFVVQTKLRGATNTVALRAVSVALLKRDY